MAGEKKNGFFPLTLMYVYYLLIITLARGRRWCFRERVAFYQTTERNVSEWRNEISINFFNNLKTHGWRVTRATLIRLDVWLVGRIDNDRNFSVEWHLPRFRWKLTFANVCLYPLSVINITRVDILERLDSLMRKS